MVLYKDDSDLKAEVDLNVFVTSTGKVREQLSLKNHTASKPVTSSFKRNKNKALVGSRMLGSKKKDKRMAVSSDKVSVSEETLRGTIIEHSEAGEVVMVQFAIVADEKTNKVVRRTLILQTENPAPQPVSMNVTSADVTENGDVKIVFGFSGPATKAGTNGFLLLEARIGVDIDGIDLRGHIDTRAIVDDNAIFVHGGWIRKKLAEQNLTESATSWSVVVMEAHALDPEKSYALVAQLSAPALTNVHHDSNSFLLTAAPSGSELAISQDMVQGRAPKEFDLVDVAEVVDNGPNRTVRHRGLAEYVSGTYKGARLLVHGYW